jgi:hypothetical protein
MKFLSFAHRFLSNFLFLATVYFSLNYIEKYQHRAVLAIIVLIYVMTRTLTAFRSFYFFQKIERLEIEARRLIGMLGEGPSAMTSRRQAVVDVSELRRSGEMMSYIDLLFLSLIAVLCIAKIVTD